MTAIVNMHQAKTELSRLVGKALAGEEVIIARANTPVVRLTPIQCQRVPGLARGELSIGADIDAPLPKDVIAGFEGRKCRTCSTRTPSCGGSRMTSGSRPRPGR